MRPDTRSDRILLSHIRECLERIEEYTCGQADRFLSSTLVQDAVLRNLQTLAESTQRLSTNIKATEPTIPWRRIAGFRNILAHDYLGLDLEAIRIVIERDLPVLGAAVDRMRQSTKP